MIKRPLDKRFADLVLEGLKFTTIRARGWPTFVPIQLYHWKGKPYRSKHQDVAEIMVEEVLEIEITHDEDGTIVFSREAIDGVPIYRSEGFASHGELEEWFRKVVARGKTSSLAMMRFKLNDPLQIGDPVTISKPGALTHGLEGFLVSHSQRLWKVSFDESWQGYYKPSELIRDHKRPK